MTKISLKSLWAHKRRLIGTTLAVFLGITFLCGTLVLGDTIRASFDDLFTSAASGTDALVRSEQLISGGDGAEDARPPLDASIVDTIEGVDGVAAVAPEVQGLGQLVDSDGDRIGGNGPPTFAANWIDNPDLNPYEVAEGRAPEAANEVIINRGAAEDGNLAIGDTTTVFTPDPVEVTIVGIATANGEDGLGPVTFTGFTLEAAQEHVLGTTDQVTDVVVQASDGVSEDELVRRLDAALPAGTEAISGTDLVTENTDAIGADFLNFFTTFLTIFAAIALLVALFSIYNTFTIIVAQRTRESALLRALGASRAQVLTAVVVEAVLMGLLASGLGVLGGLGMAALLKSVFAAVGFGFPASGLILTSGTIIASMLVGTIVTTLAGVLPAVRASRVAPLAALRDMAVDRTSSSRVRAVLGILLLGGGIASVLFGVIGGSESVLAITGLGALLMIVGLVILGPILARPGASALGAPLPAMRGFIGAMARRNATRNPRRTAATASALMVGIAVVSLFTVFGQSIKASVEESVNKSFGGDLVVGQTGFGFAPLSLDLASTLGDLDEVDTAVGIGGGAMKLDGTDHSVNAVDVAPLDSVLDLDVTSGSADEVTGPTFAVSESVAEDKGWEVGTVVPAELPDGTTEDVTLQAIYANADVMGNYLVPRDLWVEHSPQAFDFLVLVDLADGVSLDQGRAAVEEASKPFGAPNVQDREEYLGTVASGIDFMLTLIYGMLILAIIIALMGIANTLSLSVYERTRELGLLRAVGETRSQLRSMVRWEAVIVSVFGTVGGLLLGLFLGWALVEAASGVDDSGIAVFSVPVVRLIVVLIVGGLVGAVAGFFPARRAAKLDVLDAIATE